MSILPASGIGDESTGFYNGIVEQSARFRQPNSSYLYRNNSSDGNRKTMSFSWWYKRGQATMGSYNIGEFFIHGGAGAGGTQSGARITLESNKFNLAHEDNNSTSWELISNQLFRDHVQFYHFFVAIDTTQSTASNRVRVYVNGTEITSWSTSTYPSQDADLRFGQAKHYIGVSEASGNPWSATYLDGYMCDVIYIDGTALTPSSFGEFKNGTWIAKAYTGSYGTNGHRLQFKNTTSGGASPSSSTIGADTSGNNNHYNDYNFSSHDSNLPDSPENNFATMLADLAEPQDYQSYYKGTYSEGNLKVTGSSSGWSNGSSNFRMTSGKWYAECIVNSWVSSVYVRIGLRARPARTYDEYFVLGDGTGQLDAASRNGRLPSFTTGDVIQFALDLENQAFYLGKNGTWGNSATEAEIEAGTTTNAFASGSEVPIDDGYAYFFYAQPHSTGTVITWNFGQDSSFAGAKTAQGNSDSGSSTTDFYYTPPDGFLACNTVNLPDPTIGPQTSTQADDHFNTITYTGDNATSRSLTGVGFQPDWIWYKDRTNTYGHVTYDSSRGTGEKHLRIDGGVGSGTLAEGGYNDLYGTLTSFDSDGITIAKGDDTSAPSAFFNTNSASIVGWNWKANGGTTSSNTDGDITSTVQVNSTAGFSIVLFTGNGTNGSTVGHGLGVKPAWYMVKDRDTNSAGHWMVYHTMVTNIGGSSRGNADNLFLNLTNAQNAQGFGTTDPASTTTFKPSVTTYTNNSGNRYVAYVFAEVEGYSRFGSYKGNGSTDGTFVYTGFRPAWIMTKKSSGSGNWYINDTARSTFNPTSTSAGNLYADSGGAESGNGMDILSNGFKIRNTDSSQNASGSIYIYMAFAEQPFKFSNAR